MSPSCLKFATYLRTVLPAMPKSSTSFQLLPKNPTTFLVLCPALCKANICAIVSLLKYLFLPILKLYVK